MFVVAMILFVCFDYFTFKKARLKIVLKLICMCMDLCGSLYKKYVYIISFTCSIIRKGFTFAVYSTIISHSYSHNSLDVA